MKTITLNLLCISLLLFASCAKDDSASQSPPDIPVFQTKAQQVPIHQEYVGQIFGFEDIGIPARVEGYLEGIHFAEGSRVNKDALLYTLESQPFEEKVAAAMSMVAGEKTMRAKAKSDLDRIEPLAKERAVSESDLDAAKAQYEASEESVKAAEANLRAVRIQLGYTKIHSPVSGIIGKTKAKVGDFVGRTPNPVILNTVSRIDTVLVQFYITETMYLRAIRRQLSQSDAERDDSVTELDMILADGSVYEHKGKVDFIDREVDSATGSILVQASFPNPDEVLRPGQFAQIRARVHVVKDGILVPQRCIMELQGLYSVYVVGENNTVKQRETKVGPKIGRFWLVTEGLKSGEKVVYEGLQKVRNGMTVNPVIHQIQPTEEESK
ncbi:MAG: efflux RND transporter periplasmic adaptor subunit [Planctomycetota bacterium]|jgi:membrane fusion protein (multidrug efflux system)